MAAVRSVETAFFFSVSLGFSTAKGELVRSILYPKPVDFRFNRDSYKYVGVLASIALVGLIYTIVIMVNCHFYISSLMSLMVSFCAVLFPTRCLT